MRLRMILLQPMSQASTPTLPAVSHVICPIFGVDFTSAPSRRKAITIARGQLVHQTLTVSRVERIESFDAFEQLLAQPGPWVGGFDFPFGLPRELVLTLDWPLDWRALVEHVGRIGKQTFKDRLDEVRTARAAGQKYIARRGDRAAGSSSPMKLVNPPVGLMFFEGAQRLARAGVSVVPCSVNATDGRVALEAYPGFLARKITSQSYKKDGREGSTPARIAAREIIAERLAAFARDSLGINVTISSALAAESVADGSGDTLDSILCAVQAAWGAMRQINGDARCGIPLTADDFEGWIVSVPPAA
ncbi:MAG: DUF429 domain-containing protein [Betaproteobacteria bacterium]|nr:MAG: DUF429 domain-containing protein [Betaproteobacteria bacterium]